MKPAAVTAIAILLTLTLALPAAAAGSSYQVNAYPDDATFYGGSMAYDDQLTLNDQAIIAMRWVINVPFGATITSAQITLQRSGETTTCTATAAWEDSTNALNFESGPRLDQRQYLPGISATIPAAAADNPITIAADTVSLTSLVGQAGYTPGVSSIVLTIGPCADEQTGGDFYSYDTDPANAPRLIIQYTAPTRIYMIALPSGALGIVEMRASFGELAVIVAALALALLTLWAQLRQAAWLISKRSSTK